MTSDGERQSLYEAWAAALEKAADYPDLRQKWQATKAFSAAVIELAVRCERSGVAWAEVIRLAREELDQAAEHAENPVNTG